MSKAEERALEAYPVFISEYSDSCRRYDSNESDRLTFIEGYNQAEKDNELTWKDVEKIVDLYDDVYCDFSISGKGGKTNTEEHYQEVLKRFKERKKAAKGSYG